MIVVVTLYFYLYFISIIIIIYSIPWLLRLSINVFVNHNFMLLNLIRFWELDLFLSNRWTRISTARIRKKGVGVLLLLMKVKHVYSILRIVWLILILRACFSQIFHWYLIRIPRISLCSAILQWLRLWMERNQGKVAHFGAVLWLAYAVWALFKIGELLILLAWSNRECIDFKLILVDWFRTHTIWSLFVSELLVCLWSIKAVFIANSVRFTATVAVLLHVCPFEIPMVNCKVYSHLGWWESLLCPNVVVSILCIILYFELAVRVLLLVRSLVLMCIVLLKTL